MIKPSDFSGVAPFYRWLEYSVFGNALQKRRCAFLREVADAESILILGDGDGRFARELLRLTPPERVRKVDLIDNSPGMVRIAQERVRRVTRQDGSVNFQVADVRQAKLPRKYDLVATHFFLDCFSTVELQGIIQRIAQATTCNARWVISEFAIPPNGFWGQVARVLTPLMYLFFRLTAGLRAGLLPDYASALVASGFRRKQRRTAWGGFIVSELWSKGA